MNNLWVVFFGEGKGSSGVIGYSLIVLGLFGLAAFIHLAEGGLLQ